MRSPFALAAIAPTGNPCRIDHAFLAACQTKPMLGRSKPSAAKYTWYSPHFCDHAPTARLRQPGVMRSITSETGQLIFVIFETAPPEVPPANKYTPSCASSSRPPNGGPGATV